MVTLSLVTVGWLLALPHLASPLLPWSLWTTHLYLLLPTAFHPAPPPAPLPHLTFQLAWSAPFLLSPLSCRHTAALPALPSCMTASTPCQILTRTHSFVLPATRPTRPPVAVHLPALPFNRLPCLFTCMPTFNPGCPPLSPCPHPRSLSLSSPQPFPSALAASCALLSCPSSMAHPPTATPLLTLSAAGASLPMPSPSFLLPPPTPLLSPYAPAPSGPSLAPTLG